MSTTFRYSVLRWTPDPRRGERLNIGLVVMLADALDVRLLASLHKVRAIQPGCDIEALRHLPQQLQELRPFVETLEQMGEMLGAAAGASLSSPGWFSCLPGDYEEQVLKLMRRLVEPPPSPSKRSNVDSSLRRSVRDAFHKRGLLAIGIDDTDSHKVLSDYPISSEENLYADFALKNSNWHVAETIDFRAKPDTLRGDKFKQAALKAVTLDRSMKVLQNCLPIVVYAATDKDLEHVHPHIALLSQYAQRTFNYLDPDDSIRFMEHFQRAATAH